MIISKEKAQIAKARSGFSSRDLAKRYGCTVSQINSLLSKGSVRTETAGKLAKALGCDVLDIIETEK